MNTKLNSFIYNFILCGIVGWCLEILFTAVLAFRQREMTLKGTTSLWMFPIYGSMAILRPFFERIRKLCIPIRGCVYALAIFLGEYLSGSFLKKHHVCPWDYCRHRWNFQGIIRLDYFPFWFLTGLIYEKLLTGNVSTRTSDHS